MFTVISDFADKYDSSIIYEKGCKFICEDSDRIKDLLERKLIEGVLDMPSFDSLTKKELVQFLKERGIEANDKQSKNDLLKLAKGV